MDTLEGWDLGASFAMTALQHPWLTRIMILVTSLGDTSVLFGVVVAAMVLFIFKGRWRTACCLAATAMTGYAIEKGVKAWVQRPRPDPAWLQVAKPATFSFPSGHALLSLAIYGGVALYLADGMRRRGWAALAVLAGFLLPLLIGFSRMYLGLHYMSDVIGGFGAGLACIFFFRWLERNWTEAATPLPALSPAVSSHFQPEKSPAGAEHIQPAASDKIQS